ncbi:MAG TPA: hypothetical protein VGY77_09565, partial [Gemmataceae bacterium]|jgi:hypothetical protein|nr:hypothetical protein [Gemmataceae bacterium]
VDGLRWLRDYLTFRDDNIIQQRYGSWNHVMSATAQKPITLSFTLTFDAPRISGDFQYILIFRQPHEQNPPLMVEEKLSLGNRILFHQQNGKWEHPPALVTPPPPGSVMLGALTGLQEATIAHLVLTSGIGCYAFPDSVLTQPNQGPPPGDNGLSDNGDNFIPTFCSH